MLDADWVCASISPSQGSTEDGKCSYVKGDTTSRRNESNFREGQCKSENKELLLIISDETKEATETKQKGNG